MNKEEDKKKGRSAYKKQFCKEVNALARKRSKAVLHQVYLSSANMNCNLKQNVKVFVDKGRKHTKKNWKETIFEGSSWFEECCLCT